MGRETEAGLHVAGDTMYHGSEGPQKDHGMQTSVLELRSISNGQAAAGTESQELAAAAAWVQVLPRPPYRRAPHPQPNSSPRAALGGTKQQTQVCQALQVIFSHKTALKKEMRSSHLHG